MLGDVTGLDLAEVGCGGGHVLRQLGGARLTGIDPSELALETARRNLAGTPVRLLRGNVEDLDLEPASFDRILCTEVLEHTRDPDLVLTAIARLLRSDGVAVITVPNDALIRILKALAHPLGRVEWGGADFHRHAWTPAECSRWLDGTLRVTEYDAAPVRWLPVRACFRCVPQGNRR
jgi:2-polyprenyl-3-methyl-5-hydroxy-6-metoxy-1,4-benzoquinol methylase